MKKLSTRTRAIYTAIFSAILLFLLMSPISGIIISVILPPSDVKNLVISQKNNEVELNWDKSEDFDSKGYNIVVNKNLIKELAKDEVSFLITELINENEYTLVFQSVDTLNRVTSSNEIVIRPSVQFSSLNYNIIDDSALFTSSIITNIAILSLVLFVGGLWVMFFKLSNKDIVSLGLFPVVSIIPYLIFTITLNFSIASFNNKILFSFVVSIVYSIVSYLLLLTVNILNGSKKMTLPLEQAAKASQFIFSLVSFYLILIYVFSINYNFLEKILLLLPFLGYFTYSGISMLKNVPKTAIYERSIAVMLVMACAIMILTIWPVSSVYIILSLAVIYYILLNIALEFRKNLNKYVYLEYLVLVSLATLLLLSNGEWGVLGTIV